MLARAGHTKDTVPWLVRVHSPHALTLSGEEEEGHRHSESSNEKTPQKELQQQGEGCWTMNASEREHKQATDEVVKPNVS